MFGKLLKHDLKATGRVLPIVMGAVLLLVAALADKVG